MCSRPLFGRILQIKNPTLRFNRNKVYSALQRKGRRENFPRLQASSNQVGSNHKPVHRFLTQKTNEVSEPLNLNDYEKISDSTLEGLAEFFDEIGEEIENEEYDVNLSNGVLVIKLGNTLGTYVINKQTPNRQIWLSSPFSGPKRYDFVNGQWFYLHDRSKLFELLEQELSKALHMTIDLSRIMHS